jgi:hypothetical protein
VADDGHEMELSDRLVPVLELSDSEPKRVDSVDNSGVVSVDDSGLVSVESTPFPLSRLGFAVSEGLLLRRSASRGRGASDLGLNAL